MEIKTETKMIEKTITTYVACDGKIFQSEFDCKKYENNLERYKQSEILNSFLLLSDNEDSIRPCDGEEYSEDHIYNWYKIENQKQFNLINNLFNLYTNIEVKSFPEIVCIEQTENGDFYGYITTLSICKNYVKKLFGKLGYDVTFTKR